MICPNCGSDWKEEEEKMICAACGLTRRKEDIQWERCKRCGKQSVFDFMESWADDDGEDHILCSQCLDAVFVKGDIGWLKQHDSPISELLSESGAELVSLKEPTPLSERELKRKEKRKERRRRSGPYRQKKRRRKG